MKKSLFLFALLLAVLAIAGPVLAEGTAPPADHWLSPILTEVRVALGAGIASLLGMAMSWLITEAKSRELISESLARSLEGKKELYASRAVALVEGLAQSREGDVLKGSEKLKIAAKRIMRKLPGIDDDEAHELVEAALVPLGHGAGKLLVAMRSPVPAE